MEDRNPIQLPDDLPEPKDDGACRHLVGRALPSLSMKTVQRPALDLSAIPGTWVLFCFPMIGDPNNLPNPDWNLIPGARGCTPQTCGYRDRFEEFAQMNVSILGMSTQTLPELAEAHERLELPFDLVSDQKLLFTERLNLPLFSYNNLSRIRRLSLIITDGVIRHVLYPVFPANSDAPQLLDWLRKN